MSKKTTSYDDDVQVTEPEAAAEPRPRFLTAMDGTRPVWIRLSAIDAFHGLGDPVSSYRILLRSGQAFIVTATEEVKLELLDALVE
jgi:hypothetical protein